MQIDNSHMMAVAAGACLLLLLQLLCTALFAACHVQVDVDVLGPVYAHKPLGPGVTLQHSGK